MDYRVDEMLNVNVPYNFNTPSEWKKYAESMGTRQEHIVHLGFDLPAVPEHHTMRVILAI